MSDNNDKAAIVSDAGPVTGGWTNALPEAFGIREAVQNNPFRWCVRESFMWGIATGTAMGLHRLRMKSHPFFAFNVAFGTSMLVAAPSYYFCFRRREYKEQTIEMMMRANDFRHEEAMPEPVPMGEHPFMEEATEAEAEKRLRKEFVAELKERKEWQKAPPMEDRDPSKVFKEIGK
mmetsp:Transcript_2874/g.6601  ORF Transcript_2874/g.6601 Transcript_2874/m.6601 type:complete len:176 (+) Transcript_2874:134-661(+)